MDEQDENNSKRLTKICHKHSSPVYYPAEYSSCPQCKNHDTKDKSKVD